MGAFVERLRLAAEHHPVSGIQTALRLLLGAALGLAGLSHLSWSRSEFLAQVPNWFPFDADLVVVVSGVVEILIGAALLLAGNYRVLIGLVAAVFFVAIFPGNIAQLVEGNDGFGLNSPTTRGQTWLPASAHRLGAVVDGNPPRTSRAPPNAVVQSTAGHASNAAEGGRLHDCAEVDSLALTVS